MSRQAPLSGSTNGRPITVGTSLTLIHTSKTGRTSHLKMSIMNTTVGAITVTIDIGNVTAAFDLAANGIENIEIAVADGDLCQMQGSAIGLRALGLVQDESVVASA